MPSIDVVGKGESGAPEQIGATAANVGVIFGLTVIVNVVGSSTLACIRSKGI